MNQTVVKTICMLFVIYFSQYLLLRNTNRRQEKERLGRKSKPKNAQKFWLAYPILPSQIQPVAWMCCDKTTLRVRLKISYQFILSRALFRSFPSVSLWELQALPHQVVCCMLVGFRTYLRWWVVWDTGLLWIFGASETIQIAASVWCRRSTVSKQKENETNQIMPAPNHFEYEPTLLTDCRNMNQTVWILLPMMTMVLCILQMMIGCLIRCQRETSRNCSTPWTWNKSLGIRSIRCQI